MTTLLKRVIGDIKSSSGFTLIELFVMLFVLGVLTALVIPTAGKFVSYMEARSFVLQLEADISYAQKRAIATERAVTLNVNRIGRYTMDEPKGAGRRQTIKIVEFPRSVSVMNNVEVTFQPHVTFPGQSNGGTVYVRRDGKLFAEIPISLLTSRTRVIWHE